MNKTLFSVLIALCLASTAYSACDEGYAELDTVTRGNYGIPDEIDCVQCFLGCKSCEDDYSCNDLYDYVDGASLNSAGTPEYTCVGGNHWYNPTDDTCEECMTGCTSCAYDYDLCLSCKVGWDYNRGGRSCLRATLGLTAVNFVLSVLVVAGGVLTCMKASKLSWSI